MAKKHKKGHPVYQIKHRSLVDVPSFLADSKLTFQNCLEETTVKNLLLAYFWSLSDLTLLDSESINLVFKLNVFFALLSMLCV